MLLDEIEVDGCAPSVRALANAVARFDAEYRRFRQRVASAAGLSLAEFDALTAVTWTEGDVTPKRVAEAIHMTSGATTALLDRLVAAGVVERRPHPGDRRSVFIALAPAGRELVAHVYRSYVRAFNPMVGAMPAPDVDALIHSLGRVTAAVAHADDGAQPTLRDSREPAAT